MSGEGTWKPKTRKEYPPPKKGSGGGIESGGVKVKRFPVTKTNAKGKAQKRELVMSSAGIANAAPGGKLQWYVPSSGVYEVVPAGDERTTVVVRLVYSYEFQATSGAARDAIVEQAQACGFGGVELVRGRGGGDGLGLPPGTDEADVLFYNADDVSEMGSLRGAPMGPAERARRATIVAAAAAGPAPSITDTKGQLAVAVESIKSTFDDLKVNLPDDGEISFTTSSMLDSLKSIKNNLAVIASLLDKSQAPTPVASDGEDAETNPGVVVGVASSSKENDVGENAGPAGSNDTVETTAIDESFSSQAAVESFTLKRSKGSGGKKTKALGASKPASLIEDSSSFSDRDSYLCEMREKLSTVMVDSELDDDDPFDDLDEDIEEFGEDSLLSTLTDAAFEAAGPELASSGGSDAAGASGDAAGDAADGAEGDAGEGTKSRRTSLVSRRQILSQSLVRILAHFEKDARLSPPLRLTMRSLRRAQEHPRAREDGVYGIIAMLDISLAPVSSGVSPPMGSIEALVEALAMMSVMGAVRVMAVLASPTTIKLLTKILELRGNPSNSLVIHMIQMLIPLARGIKDLSMDVLRPLLESKIVPKLARHVAAVRTSAPLTEAVLVLVSSLAADVRFRAQFEEHGVEGVALGALVRFAESRVIIKAACRYVYFICDRESTRTRCGGDGLRALINAGVAGVDDVYVAEFALAAASQVVMRTELNQVFFFTAGGASLLRKAAAVHASSNTVVAQVVQLMRRLCAHADVRGEFRNEPFAAILVAAVAEHPDNVNIAKDVDWILRVLALQPADKELMYAMPGVTDTIAAAKALLKNRNAYI